MINIVSRSVASKNTSGPKKVVDNLIKGLDRIGYPYVVNAALDACERLWIHDDTKALKSIASLSGVSVIVGPNLYVLPSDISSGIDLTSTLYIHPSDWVIDLWKERGFTSIPMETWPVGIDTDMFAPSSTKKDHVLVYLKKRSLEDLAQVELILSSRNTGRTVVQYGRYTEQEYQQMLARARYVIWIGCPESQGIALEEALSADVPVLAWEDDRTSHFGGYSDATSIPYFDDRCGIKVSDIGSLEDSIERMEANLESFTPRAYILENLSLEKQAREFVSLYESRFGLSYEAGLQEKVRHAGMWRNAKLRYRAFQGAKDLAKRFLKN